MDEQALVVALAAALANVRALDADTRVPFADVFCALEAVEGLLFEHKGRFGVISVLFQRGCEEFLLLSNTLAMQALQTASPQDSATAERCRELLERAEQHTRRTGYLRSLPEAQHVSRRRVFLLLTLNNLACHAKHTRSPLAALGFLERALKLQLQPSSAETGQSTAPTSELALTRLNICAVLSQLERHAAAATHAKAAVAQLLQAQELDTEAAQLLLVAHYNLAVELEHLSECKAARRQYECVLTVAASFGLQHDVVHDVRSLLARDSSAANTSVVSPPARTRTPRERQLLQRRPLSPRTLRQTRA